MPFNVENAIQCCIQYSAAKLAFKKRSTLPVSKLPEPYKVNGVLIRQRRSTQPRGAHGGTPLQLVHLSKPALPDIAGDLGNYFDVERFGDDPVGL